MVNNIIFTSSSSSSNHNNNSNNSKKSKGLARLFQRKQQPPPLCKQDSCSFEDSDDDDEHHDDLDQDMSNSSSVYSLTSEKENNHGTSGNSSSAKGSRSPKFIDIDSGELSDLKTLISPSGVNGMPLRKVPLSEHLILQDRNMRGGSTAGAERASSPSSPAAAWFDGGNGTNIGNAKYNHDHHDTKGESAFDLNMPQSFSDSDFDIPSFQNLGSNPFQSKDSNPSSNETKGNDANEDDREVGGGIQVHTAEKDKQKKQGFLKQMKHQFSKSIKRDVMSKKDSSVVPATTANTTTTMTSSSTRNDKKGRGLKPPRNSLPTSIPSKSTPNKEQIPFQVSDETPKFTNKSMKTNSNTTTSPPKNGSSDKSEAEKTIFTRSALSRPFGRTSLPSQLAKQWCVEVSPFYDDLGKCWKYRILVQREEYANKGNTFFSPVKTNNAKTASSPNSVMMQPMDSPSSPDMNNSFAAANVTRTLKDIAWLERALRDEYQGALMFPALAMTLTSGTDWTTAVTLDKDTFERGEWDPYHLSNELFNVVLEEDEFQGYDVDDEEDRNPPFDPKLISDWFNDVLNGVRGKGELILNYCNSQSVDVIHSESMECFLYKVNEPLVDLHFMTNKSSNFSWLPFRLDFGKLALSESKDENDEFTLMKGLMTFPVTCLSCNPTEQISETDSIMSRRTKNRNKQHSPEYWQKSTLPEDLKAQSLYIGVQRENALMAMYRLRILLETEALVSVAWKRFAISLSNLFTAGKDIESCKVGGSKGKKSVPKISKEKVDDCLRILARQKVDRATPSLKVLSGMLSAYYADFSSVNPSLQAYSDGLKKLESERESISNSSDDNWKQALKAVSPLTLFQDTDDVRDTHALEMEMRVFEQRQIFNENLIKSSIIQLCNSIDVRVSRMSWKFFKMEAGQARLLMNAANQVESVLKDPGESIDLNVIGQEGEVDLVRRILDLGSKRKYKYHPYTKSCSSSHTGSESDLISENGSTFMDESVTENVSTHNPAIDKLIENVRKCDGCWDSEVAMGILRMAGVDDGEIQVQESTREVRTVQRLADSLRVQIDRCSETLSMLLELAYGNEAGRLTKNRRDFMSDLSVVFSGSMNSKNRRKSRDLREYEKILIKDGINVHDSFGWLSISHKENHHDNNGGCCGDVASKYENVRELGTLQLIEQLEELLKDQRDRVKRMESFVFMNCVGIQIEKHYSRSRSEALAAWEKKTDITTAINIATKKRLPLLVKELKSKLALLSPISHTSVKEAKERHLGSKALKSELESLASSRFEQLKKCATDGVVEAIRIWTMHEKDVAKREISALSETINEIEKSLRNNDKIIEADGGAHLFASSGIS